MCRLNAVEVENAFHWTSEAEGNAVGPVSEVEGDPADADPRHILQTHQRDQG